MPSMIAEKSIYLSRSLAFTPRGSAVRARHRPPQKSAIFYKPSESVGRFACTAYQSKAAIASAMNRGE
jgi:hypothetical protein